MGGSYYPRAHDKTAIKVITISTSPLISRAEVAA